jgi:hypothetical protein
LIVQDINLEVLVQVLNAEIVELVNIEMVVVVAVVEV